MDAEAGPRDAQREPGSSGRSRGTVLVEVAVGLILLVGCATPQLERTVVARPREDQVAAFARAQETLERSFPPGYRATHRAVITVGKRQYVCDGSLAVDPANGLHLALVSTLGLVGEVRLRSDGAGEVVKVTPLFREEWSRDHVLRDLRWLFTPPGPLQPAGTSAEGCLVLQSTRAPGGARAHYRFSADGRRWEGLEMEEPGRPIYRAVLGSHRRRTGWPQELPGEIQVDAGTYRLHLRVAEWSVRAPADSARAASEASR